jgi:hypothetical protein
MKIAWALSVCFAVWGCAGFCLTTMPPCIFCGKSLGAEQSLKKHRARYHPEADTWLCAHRDGPAPPAEQPSDETPLARHTWCASLAFFSRVVLQVPRTRGVDPKQRDAQSQMELPSERVYGESR